jgi:hypothetical protein
MLPISSRRLWASRILFALVTLFLVVDAGGKLARLDPVVAGTLELGYPASSVVPIGLLLAIGVALYAVPRTAVLGAIYLTGYLGGAIATHVRVGNPLPTHTLFPVYVAGLLWLALVLRHPGLVSVLIRGGREASPAPVPHGTHQGVE